MFITNRRINELQRNNDFTKIGCFLSRIKAEEVLLTGKIDFTEDHSIMFFDFESLASMENYLDKASNEFSDNFALVITFTKGGLIDKSGCIVLTNGFEIPNNSTVIFNGFELKNFEFAKYFKTSKLDDVLKNGSYPKDFTESVKKLIS